jgi:transforming acidic coiled-coil-containing protein 3
LIAEKEQIQQNSEKQCTELRHESEINAQHLASLEQTFSDIHAKYERTKQIASELKEREEVLLQERKQNAENLRMQEIRYEKMKSHAMAQLEM